MYISVCNRTNASSSPPFGGCGSEQPAREKGRDPSPPTIPDGFLPGVYSLVSPGTFCPPAELDGKQLEAGELAQRE